MNKNIVEFIPLVVFASADMTANFKFVSTIGFPLRYLHFSNITDVRIIISYDGVYGNVVVNTLASRDFYPQSCSSPTNCRSVFKKNTKIYVKTEGALPKAGGLIVSGYY